MSQVLDEVSRRDFCSFEKKEIMFFGPKVDLTPAEFSAAREQNGGKVLDCRSGEECEEGIVEGAIQADWMNGEVPNAVAAWDKKEPVYCYCRSGGRSGAAAKYLRDAGFESVFNVGGYSALKGR
ncbi:MAG: rhodanese-like domain-containing protein [Flavobacteriales bacterium]|nr:rhodanese-like domain-containing protein [Flavobacteriales bacterium]